MNAAGNPDRARAALAARGPRTAPADEAPPSSALAASRSSSATILGGSTLAAGPATERATAVTYRCDVQDG